MNIISRGFSGRRSSADAKLPPGQYLTTDFPVLSAGPTPHVSLDKWEFTISDGNDVSEAVGLEVVPPIADRGHHG